MRPEHTVRTGTAAAPLRGRPRSEKARTATLEAAADLLLAHGLAAVTMDAVAARAGVSKATIYRWWPTKETLALDLLSLLRPWARLASRRPYGRVIAALVTEAQTDPVFAAQYRERFVEPRRSQGRAAFRRAAERGEVPAGINIELALDLLYGPLYHRLLHGHAPLSDQFVRDVVDAALNGIASPRPAAPGTPAPARRPRPQTASEPADTSEPSDT
jgi:AcrR family transcriptional regulator